MRERREIEAQLRQIGDLVVSDGQHDYESLLQRLAEARNLFHELLADRLTQPFNEHLASLPQQTLEEKQMLTRDANADLRRIGLAIKCPKTGEPAMLHAQQNYYSGGRFQIGLISTDLNRKRTVSSCSLMPVALMTCPLRRESLAERWSERVANRDSQPRRE